MLALKSALVVALTAAGHAPVTPSAGKALPRQHVRAYERAYQAVVRKFGHRAPGRQIVRWGFAPGKPVTDREVVASLAVLHRMLAPPSALTAAPAPTAASDSTVQTPSVSYQQAPSSGGSLPYCTWGPESGGNWSAVNPSSGAGGRYQILPSTWAAYGGSGSPQDASPAEQTAIASKIYAGGSGASQWVNC